MALDVALERRVLRFREPLVTAHGTLTQRELVAVDLRDEDGATGHGEAAPLEPYDGVSLAVVAAELEAAGAQLRAAEGLSPAGLRDRVAACVVLPQARSALDTALWDLEARRAGLPLAALLCATPAAHVAVNASIGALEPGAAVAAARAAVSDGYSTIKLKVGAGDDVERVRAVRHAIGDRAALRIDANGAWSVDQAVDHLHALTDCDLEFCEEPVHGLEALAAVRARAPAAVAIAADETVAAPAALRAAGVDVVCLKLSARGGVTGLLAAAREASAGGLTVVVTSTYDGPAGIAASVHVAAALDPAPPACGLATLSCFSAGDAPALRVVAGRICVPAAPGLGLDGGRRRRA